MLESERNGSYFRLLCHQYCMWRWLRCSAVNFHFWEEWKQSVVAHARNSITREVEAEGSWRLWSQPGLQREFRDSLHCREKPYLKTTQRKQWKQNQNRGVNAGPIKFIVDFNAFFGELNSKQIVLRKRTRASCLLFTQPPQMIKFWKITKQ